jgi:hypothetical protein
MLETLNTPVFKYLNYSALSADGSWPGGGDVGVGAVVLFVNLWESVR